MINPKEQVINPHELRIGNVLEYKGGVVAVTFLSLDIDDEYQETIGFVKFGTSSNEHADWNRALYLDLKRIPLTPEWLERMGFDKRKATEDGEYWGILNFTLIYARTDEGSYGWFLNGYHNDCHLHYVHQLQNLFYHLSGEELVVKEISK